MPKLYKVNLQGMIVASTGPTYGEAYVVADDPTEAYTKLREKLDKWDVGFKCELGTIELVSDTLQYGSISKVLYI